MIRYLLRLHNSSQVLSHLTEHHFHSIFLQDKAWATFSDNPPAVITMKVRPRNALTYVGVMLHLCSSHTRIRVQDIPWPHHERLFAHPVPSMAAGAVAVRRKPAMVPTVYHVKRRSQRSGCSAEPLASLCRADLKALRARWHPDRFLNKFGARLAPEERDDIMARVTNVAAKLNAQNMQHAISAPAILSTPAPELPPRP